MTVARCLAPTPREDEGRHRWPKRAPYPAQKNFLSAPRAVRKGGEGCFAVATEWRLWRGLRSFPMRRL
jgi:hypothetical protein